MTTNDFILFVFERLNEITRLQNEQNRIFKEIATALKETLNVR